MKIGSNIGQTWVDPPASCQFPQFAENVELKQDPGQTVQKFAITQATFDG